MSLSGGSLPAYEIPWGTGTAEKPAQQVPGTPGLQGGSARSLKTKITREQQSRPSVYPRESDVREYPKGIFEATWTVIFGDRDKKWGPWYKHVRAAKKEGRWQEWDTADIVAQEPIGKDDIIDPDEDARTSKGRSAGAWDLRYQLADDVRPAHIDIEEILGVNEHPGDYSNEFFQTQWRSLYENLLKLVEKYFDCDIDLRYLRESQTGPNQIWSMIMVDQFKEYARLAAQEDPKLGGWPALLNESRQRKFLIVGILSQILEKKIFNELLFGADEATKRELERMDDIWISKEGYGRKAARATVARYAMETSLMPRNFWNKVDDLSARTLKIFLPLLNVMKLVWPNDGQYRTQEAFLQELHFVFAHAGMIQVCTAVSPSIFHLLSATPGARMDYELETQSNHDIYRESKEYHELENQYWNEYVVGSMSGRPIQNRTGGPIKVPASREEYNLMEYHRIRGARVKMAVFPQLTRYVPVNKGLGFMPDLNHEFDDNANMNDYKENSEGQDVVTISKCWVIYRQGLIYLEDGYIETMTLDQHLASLVRSPNGIFGFFWWIFKALCIFTRKSFWHLLLISFIVSFFASLYFGSNFFYYLLTTQLPAIIFSSFCLVYLTRFYWANGKYFSAYVTVGIPIAAMYVIGIANWVMTQTELVNDPENEALRLSQEWLDEAHAAANA